MTVALFLRDHADAMLADLRAFVERETPSLDKALLDRFAEFLVGYAAGAPGGEAEILPSSDGGNHVRVRWPGEQGLGPIMLLGHFDTVWPAGTLATMPFEVEDGVARGPGAFDMKCGLVQGFWAVRAYRQAGGRRPLVFLCNSDEEIGSPTSRALIEDEARRASTVLVLEPSLDGALKTARKGAGRFRVQVTGRPAHAGLDPFGGVSAIEELARLVLDLHGHTDADTGTTVNVGELHGGTRFNVIAAEAWADVDLRVVTRREAERMTRVLLELRPHHSEAEVHVGGGLTWPPMERTETIAGLSLHARGLANELGFELPEALAGGASDGSFCAALGVPVLDGLGAVGGGAHAREEHVLTSAIPERSALVARLLETLDAPIRDDPSSHSREEAQARMAAKVDTEPEGGAR